ncbi:citrate lyase acyl carrier protein [bacterium]|nr:citrate lyase acyl carrier protein [bacterium]
MKLIRCSSTGRQSKGDIYIELAPGKEGGGIEVELTSSQKALFGKAILASIKGKIKEFGIQDAKVKVIDDGALDFVIQARTEAAILAASGEEG